MRGVMFLNERLETLRYLLLFVFVFLIGCSKSEPIKFTDSQKQYIGVWLFLYESKTNSSVDIRNILLVINADSTAVYKQCIVSKTVNENSITSSIRNISIPNANIVGLVNSEITLAQESEFLHVGTISFNHDLEITKAPYLENGRWYMGIENNLLEKSEDSGTGSQIEWDCPEIDEENINE